MAEKIKTKKAEVSVAASEKAPKNRKVQKAVAVLKESRAVKKSDVVAKKKKSSVKKTATEVVAPLVKNNKRKTEKVVEKKRGGQEEYFLRWTAPDFVRTVGEEYLYRASLVLATLMVVWSVWHMDILTALLFAVLIVVVVFELRSQPKEIGYEVNLSGVVVDGRLLRFSEIRSFDLSEKAGLNIVRLQMKTAVFPMKEIFLDEKQDLVYVKTLFEYFLPEEKQEDKLFNFKEKKELTEEEFLDKVVDDYVKGKF